MFKKIIIIALTVSFLILTACSGSPQESSFVIVAEQPVTSQEKESEVLDVPEFIKRALNNKYESGDIVLISGTVLETGNRIDQVRSGQYRFIMLGPGTSGFMSKFESEGIIGGSEFEPGYDSYSSLAKTQEGDEVIVRGTYGHVNDSNKYVYIDNATVQ